MTQHSSNPAPPQDDHPGKPHDSKSGITQEQVRAIADRVYAMLLRDLKQARERERISFGTSRLYKGGA